MCNLRVATVHFLVEGHSLMLLFQEEDIRNFRMKLQQIHRPSCVAIEKDLRKMNLNARVNDSMLGKVIHKWFNVNGSTFRGSNSTSFIFSLLSQKMSTL